MQPVKLSKAPIYISLQTQGCLVLLHLFIAFESNYCLPHKQLGEECDEKLQGNLHLPCVSNNEKIIIENYQNFGKNY